MATTQTRPCFYELLLLYTELRYCRKFSDIISVVSWSLYHIIHILGVDVFLEIQTVKIKSLGYREKFKPKYSIEWRIIERSEVVGSTGDAKSESQAADILQAATLTPPTNLVPRPSHSFPPSRFSFSPLPTPSLEFSPSPPLSLLLPCSVDKKTARKIISCLWKLLSQSTAAILVCVCAEDRDCRTNGEQYGLVMQNGVACMIRRSVCAIAREEALWFMR